MAYVSDLLAAGRTCSFEFFPPKTDDAARALEETIAELAPLDPSFVSVTYGAGGSTRERTRDVVINIERNIGITAMAHLTCVGHTRAQLDSLLDEYKAAGVSNILALAGDLILDDDGMVADSDFEFAMELVELIKEKGDFSIGVAAHPEGHPRSEDLYSDRRHLADKLTPPRSYVSHNLLVQSFRRASHPASMRLPMTAMQFVRWAWSWPANCVSGYSMKARRVCTSTHSIAQRRPAKSQQILVSAALRLLERKSSWPQVFLDSSVAVRDC